MRKKEAKQYDPPSHWEETWHESDYKEHEQFFAGMLVEYRNIMVLCGNDPIIARSKWLEKNKAVSIKGKEEFANPSSYSMYSAQFGKFCEWLSFQERMDPSYETKRDEAFKKVKEGMKKVGVISKQVDSELNSLEQLSEEANDETKHEFNNQEI